MSTTLYYCASGDETGHRYQVTLEADYDLDDGTWNDSVAEQCASDFWSNRDGWEHTWPREFILFKDKIGPSFARFEVQMEVEPRFDAFASQPQAQEGGR